MCSACGKEEIPPHFTSLALGKRNTIVHVQAQKELVYPKSGHALFCRIQFTSFRSTKGRHSCQRSPKKYMGVLEPTDNNGTEQERIKFGIYQNVDQSEQRHPSVETEAHLCWFSCLPIKQLFTTQARVLSILSQALAIDHPTIHWIRTTKEILLRKESQNKYFA